VAQELLQSSPAWTTPLDMGTLSTHWCPSVQVENSVQKLPRSLASCAILLALVASQPLLQATSLVLGPLPSRWASSVSPPHLAALVWLKVAQRAQLLAFVAQEPLQPPPPWSQTVAMGQVQAHWRPPLPLAHAVRELPRALAPSEDILVSLAQKPLLQASKMVLGRIPTSWSPPLPSTNPETLGWQSLARRTQILAFLQKELLQSPSAWTTSLDVG